MTAHFAVTSDISHQVLLNKKQRCLDWSAALLFECIWSESHASDLIAPVAGGGIVLEMGALLGCEEGGWLDGF